VGPISLFIVAVIVVGFSFAAGRYAFRFRELKQEVFQQFKVENHVFIVETPNVALAS
jgi:hypothetical protein